ncbi:MAG: CD225/dispanin family protein [Longimicrobiaceae bacterium]
MALMTCPDCANQYPDDAPYCPNCGRPNPARQAGNAGAAAGGASETPAGSAGGTPPGGTGSTGSSGSTGNTFGGGGSTGGAGSTAGSTGGASTGGGYGGTTSSTYTAGASETPAGGGYTGGTGYGGPGGTGGTGGYGGGGYGGGGGGYGGTPAGASPPQQIPNYLVHAILVTLCCCLPFGIVSIIYATQVNAKRDAGDIAGAMEASNNAKKWAMIGAGVGVVWLIIVIAFNGLAFLAALAGGGGAQ